MDDAAETETFDTMNLVIRPPHRVFACAWTAYIKPVFYFLLFLFIGYLMANLFWIAGTVWMLLSLALFLYSFLSIRSIKLYTDNEGVWLFSGIFPWNKGIGGVKWRDLDEATFTQSFFSWALKAHSIRIGHRFTKANEIWLTNIRNGDDAVMHINRLHLQRINQTDEKLQAAATE